MSCKTSNDIIAGNNNVLQKISRNVLCDTFDKNLLLKVIYGEILGGQMYIFFFTVNNFLQNKIIF